MGALQELWEASLVEFNSGQIERVAERYADDAVWVTPGETLTGPAAVLARLRHDLTAFPDGRINTLNCAEAGDTLVAEYEFVGTHTGPWTMPDGSQRPATGAQVTIRAVSVHTIVDGKVMEHRMYADRLPIALQLNLLG